MVEYSIGEELLVVWELVEISNVCIDDTQGFDVIRFYNGYAPTLRSQRSGLKILEDTSRE